MSAESPNFLEVQERLSEREICELLLKAGAVSIRDIDGGEEAFRYSSGNWGPGYINIKGLCGRQEVFKVLTRQLAFNLIVAETQFDFIAANATGGMTPGYQLREDLQALTGLEIPFVYVRGTRKPGGHRELVTGVSDNPFISEGETALVVEELINFAQTTTNSALALRNLKFRVDSAATVLHYQNPKALERLAENNLMVVELTSLPTLLRVAEEEGFFEPRLIEDYQSFLENPLRWQERRGLEPVQI